MAARSAQPARPRSCTSVTARYWSPTAPLPRRRSRSAATASSSAPTGTRPSGSRPDIRWRGPPGSRCDPTGTRPGITDGPAAPSGRNINGVKSVLLAMQNESRLAVLGAGHVGPVIARLAIGAGYPVAIATSGDPDDIALSAELVIPGARPRWASDAIADADIVVLAIPLHRFAELDPGLLAGKIVIDAMNYWPASDGVLTAFEDGGASGSGRGSSE